MAINNVCRLCMSDKELVWVFDQRFGDSEKNMKNVVMVTTGVEVLEKDIISQNICNNCCKLTVKMFEFRERAVKTDQYLKNQCKELLADSDIKLKIPNTSVSITKEKKIDKCKVDLVPTTNKFTIKLLPIKSEVTKEDKSVDESMTTEIAKENKPTDIKLENPKDVQKKHKKNIHSSIDKIFSTYADIKIPTGCLKLDVNPFVSMEMNCVEEYFKRRNVDMKKHVQMVLRPMRATKRTLPVNYTKSTKKYHENGIVFVEENKPGTSKDFLKYLNSPESIKLAEVINQVNKRQSDDCVVNETSSVKKRRLSSSDLISSPETIHPTLMETLQLKPNENLLIHRCRVCNIPQINAKVLKKHYRAHFICSYCKSKFKLADRQEKHVKTCAVKLALTCQAYVNLERLDLKKYKLKTFKLSTTEEMIFSFHEPVTKEDEIIELSDDEDNTTSCATVLPSASVNTTPQVPESMPIPSLVPLTAKQTINPATEQHTINPATEQQTINLVTEQQTINPAAEQQIINPVTEPVQYISTAIVKPSIQINDNHVLSTIDTSSTDMKVLKEIITKTGTINMKLSVDGEAQTILPSNDLIVLNSLYETAELKKLLPHLYVFKVPIKIKHGQFNVSYNENEQEDKKRKLKNWSKLKPVDVTGINSAKMNFNLSRRLKEDISLFAKTPKAKILNYSLTQPNNSSQNNQTGNFRFQAPQSSTVQTGNVPQQIPASKVQMYNLPQTKQLTSNAPKHFLPNVVQTSNIQTPILTYPGKNVSQQTHQQTQNANQIPSYRSQNIPQVPSFASNNYFDLTNEKTINSTNSNMQGFVNTNTNIPSTQQNMGFSTSQTYLPLNHTLSPNNSMSMPNLTTTMPRSVINTIPLPFPARKTPPPNVNLFSSTNQASNSNVACSSKVNNSKGQSVNKPLIRVKNLCDLT